MFFNKLLFLAPSVFLSFILLFVSLTKPVQAFVAPGMTVEGTLTNGTNFGFNPQYGDINGDSNQDMIINVSTCASNKGCLYIYFGNGSSFSTTANIMITGEASSDYLGGQDFGNSFSVGDVNGDNYDDILIGAYGNDEAGSLAGKIYVFYGSYLISGDKIASQADLSALGNLTDKKYFGTSVKITDINNDNQNDIIIVAGTNNYATTSIIYTFLNSNNTFNFSSPNFINLTSGTNTSAVGYWQTNSADFDGDGNIDLLVADTFLTGKIYLFKGFGTGEFTQTSIFNQEASSNLLARYGSVSIADINNDQKDDFCAGAYRNSTIVATQGRVYCFLGRASFSASYSVTEANFILNGQSTLNNFGKATYLYDITNDGKSDLLIGAHQLDASAGLRHGKFYIYKNTSGTFTDSPWLSEIKTSGNTVYGFSVSAMDWDNDGWANITVTQGGTSGNGTGDPVINYYEISHGTPTITPSLTLPSTITGTATDSNTDYSISGVEWSTSSNTSGTWTDCSGTTTFSCDISSVVNDSGRNIYVRTHDQNDLYIPPQLYATAQTLTHAGAGGVCSNSSLGLTAPYITSATKVDSTSVLLKFTDWSVSVDHFVLEYGTKTGKYSYSATDISKDQRSYLVKSLHTNTKYYFRIRANNGCAVGPWSDEETNVINNRITPTPKTAVLTEQTSLPIPSLKVDTITEPQLTINLLQQFVNFFKNLWNKIRT